MKKTKKELMEEKIKKAELIKQKRSLMLEIFSICLFFEGQKVQTDLWLKQSKFSVDDLIRLKKKLKEEGYNKMNPASYVNIGLLIEKYERNGMCFK